MIKINSNVAMPIVGAAFLLIVSGLLLKHASDSQRIEDSLTNNVVELQTRLSDLQTCYDNDLRPCTDESIKAYNRANGLYPQ